MQFKKTKSLKINNQPPKKVITAKALIKIMLEYSAKKNRAKPIDEYSTLKPLTSSLSASGRSKGALFVSAKILIKNIKKSGNNGIIKKTKFWKDTMLIKFRVPTQTSIVTNIKPMQIS